MRRKSNVTRVMTFFSASPDPYYQIRAEPAHPVAIEFLSLWREEACTRELIVGKDVPSRAFARFLSYLTIVEPIDNDTDCRIRVAGDAVRQRYKRDVKDVRFSDIFSSAVAADNMMRLREVRRTGIPIIFDAAIIHDDAPAICYEALLLRIFAPDEQTYWNVVGIFMLDA